MEHIKEMFDINFFGGVRLTQAVLPGMKARQDGYIVNVSSIFGITGAPFNDMYSAAKFAMGGLTESLAPVLKQFNIKWVIFVIKVKSYGPDWVKDQL